MHAIIGVAFFANIFREVFAVTCALGDIEMFFSCVLNTPAVAAKRGAAYITVAFWAIAFVIRDDHLVLLRCSFRCGNLNTFKHCVNVPFVRSLELDPGGERGRGARDFHVRDGVEHRIELVIMAVSHFSSECLAFHHEVTDPLGVGVLVSA